MSRSSIVSPASLGALAAGLGCVSLALAQAPVGPAPAASQPALPTVTVKGGAVAEPQGKDAVQATTTRLGKGQQELRDVPQSVTVVTERLLDDRQLDTLKDALRNTAGITFQAAEGAEEDIRLRGFSLQASGDIFVDGLRDPAFYERDSFNWDRLELLRGSASMLFGRGSTGGAANQVSKEPTTQLARREVALTLGSGETVRATADLNVVTGDSSALRATALLHQGDASGLKTDKQGLALAGRWGIGLRDELLASVYHLRNDNGVNYGIPWLTPVPGATTRALVPIDPRNYYGMASDKSAGGVDMLTLRHVRRFDDRSGEWRTTVRVADYTRDLRASAIRFAAANLQPDGQPVTAATLTDATVLNRGTNIKRQDMRTLYAQSDMTRRWRLGGVTHEVAAGVDVAREQFENYAVATPAGVTLTKPRTTIGTPNDGAWIDESLRAQSVNRSFEARGVGVYAQNLMQIAPHWKLLAGLRWDKLEGSYRNIAVAAPPTNVCAVPVAAEVRRDDSLFSHRVGVLYQPTPLQSYHLSYGTSFNTAGDAYQYDAGNADVAPEKSRNLELGAKLDFADGAYSVRGAIFHSTKTNERNRDADTVNACNYVLSGKRHAAGVELDVAGRLTPRWEIFLSYSFIPDAEIDAASPAAGAGQLAGDPVGLTPRHSGTVWTTYQLTPTWRVGGGLTARSGAYPVGITAFVAPRFVTADLMAEYKPSDTVALQVNLTNVTDKLYADQVYRGHYIPGKPRTLLVATTLQF
jgi:catecholate siderophore receptor